MAAIAKAAAMAAAGGSVAAASDISKHGVAESEMPMAKMAKSRGSERKQKMDQWRKNENIESENSANRHRRRQAA
jgi:hypothetical protein